MELTTMGKDMTWKSALNKNRLKKIEVNTMQESTIINNDNL
jgi:hypothetical protein